MSRRKKSSTGDRGSSDAYLNEVKDQQMIKAEIIHNKEAMGKCGQPAQWTKVFRTKPETGEKYLALHIENGVTLFEINP